MDRGAQEGVMGKTNRRKGLTEQQVEEMVSARLVAKFAASELVWVTPMMLIEHEGMQYHVPTSRSLEKMGAEMDQEKLNYWRLPEVSTKERLMEKQAIKRIETKEQYESALKLKMEACDALDNRREDKTGLAPYEFARLLREINDYEDRLGLQRWQNMQNASSIALWDGGGAVLRTKNSVYPVDEPAETFNALRVKVESRQLIHIEADEEIDGVIVTLRTTYSGSFMIWWSPEA